MKHKQQQHNKNTQQTITQKKRTNTHIKHINGNKQNTKQKQNKDTQTLYNNDITNHIKTKQKTKKNKNKSQYIHI